MLGFSQSIIVAYLIFYHSRDLTHCNFGPNLNARTVFGHAQISSLHHTSQKEGIDKTLHSFSVIDKIFGTYYYPEEWPEVMAWMGSNCAGFFRQTIEPLRKKKNALKIHAPNGTSLGKSAPLVVAFTKPKYFMILTVTNPKSYSDCLADLKRPG